MRKKKLTEEELRFNEDIKKVVLDILEEDKEIGKKLFDGGHKIGGFPNFTQSDVREIGDYEILLLQIDSEGTEKNEIMWGDCGIANFFIREKDLKELNFYKTIYNWDCCKGEKL